MTSNGFAAVFERVPDLHAQSAVGEIARLLREGYEHLEHDRCANAMDTFFEAYTRAVFLLGGEDIDAVTARRGLAMTAYALGRENEAAEQFLDLVQDSEHVDSDERMWCLYWYARSLLDRGEFAAASYELGRAIGLRSREADGGGTDKLWLRAWQLVAKRSAGELDAEAKFESLITALPPGGGVTVDLLRARMARAAKRYEEAVAAYERVFAKPGRERPSELDRYAYALETLGRPSETIRARAASRRIALSAVRVLRT
jgi:hypothetical protein